MEVKKPTGRSIKKGLGGPGCWRGKLSEEVRWMIAEAEAALLEAERIRSDINTYGERLGNKPGRTELVCDRPEVRVIRLLTALNVWCKQRQISLELCTEQALQQGDAARQTSGGAQ